MIFDQVKIGEFFLPKDWTGEVYMRVAHDRVEEYGLEFNAVGIKTGEQIWFQPDYPVNPTPAYAILGLLEK